MATLYKYGTKHLRLSIWCCTTHRCTKYPVPSLSSRALNTSLVWLAPSTYGASDTTMVIQECRHSVWGRPHCRKSQRTATDRSELTHPLGQAKLLHFTFSIKTNLRNSQVSQLPKNNFLPCMKAHYMGNQAFIVLSRNCIDVFSNYSLNLTKNIKIKITYLGTFLFWLALSRRLAFSFIILSRCVRTSLPACAVPVY